MVANTHTQRHAHTYILQVRINSHPHGICAEMHLSGRRRTIVVVLVTAPGWETHSKVFGMQISRARTPATHPNLCLRNGRVPSCANRSWSSKTVWRSSVGGLGVVVVVWCFLRVYTVFGNAATWWFSKCTHIFLNTFSKWNRALVKSCGASVADWRGAAGEECTNASICNRMCRLCELGERGMTWAGCAMRCNKCRLKLFQIITDTQIKCFICIYIHIFIC